MMLEGKRLNEWKMRRKKKEEKKKEGKKKKKKEQNPSMTSLPSDSWERVHWFPLKKKKKTKSDCDEVAYVLLRPVYNSVLAHAVWVKNVNFWFSKISTFQVSPLTKFLCQFCIRLYP